MKRRADESTLVQEAGDARLEVAVREGGRIRSLRIGDLELIRQQGPSTFEWGSYPMAPWNGRTRRGRFTFDGRSYDLPVNFGDHAIHGTVYDRAWRVEDDASLSIDLGPHWPFPGSARQRFALEEGQLKLRLEVHAATGAMPASCGWHPWFLRRLGRGAPARIAFDAAYVDLTDAEGLPNGQRGPVPPGPWDNSFGGVHWPATVEWPGALRLEISSSCGHLVVFDQRAEAVCIEPCTAPPNSLNHGAAVVRPGTPLVAESLWEWRPL